MFCVVVVVVVRLFFKISFPLRNGFSSLNQIQCISYKQQILAALLPLSCSTLFVAFSFRAPPLKAVGGRALESEVMTSNDLEEGGRPKRESAR